MFEDCIMPGESSDEFDGHRGIVSGVAGGGGVGRQPSHKISEPPTGYRRYVEKISVEHTPALTFGDPVPSLLHIENCLCH